MDPVIGSALISGGSNLLGGLLGGSSGPSVTKTMKMQRAMNALEYERMRDAPSAMMKGAKKAGIHPAVLFGGSFANSSPVSVGQVNDGGNNWGANMASMGQDISRAIDTQRDIDERTAFREQAGEIQKLQLNQQALRDTAEIEHMGLQNELLRTQIAKLRQQETPPAPLKKKTSDAGVIIRPYNQFKQSDQVAGKWETTSAQVTSADPHTQSLTAGPPNPSHTRFRIGGKHLGYYLEAPAGQNFSESLESSGPIEGMVHNKAHQVLRALETHIHGPGDKPKIALPPGYRWSWNRSTQSWRAKKGG